MPDTFTLDELDKPQTLSLDELDQPAKAESGNHGLSEFITSPHGFIREGARKVGQGISELMTSGQRQRGAAHVIQGAGSMLAPVGIGAAIPAAVVAPAATAASIALGTGGAMVGGYGGREAVKALHGGEDAQQLGETLGETAGGLFGGATGAKLLHRPATAVPTSAGPTLSSGSTYREAPPSAGTTTYGGGPKVPPNKPSTTPISSVPSWASTTPGELQIPATKAIGKLESPTGLSKEETIKGIMKGMRADRATAEALYEKMPKSMTAPAAPAAKPVPPAADPNFKLNLGPQHTKEIAKINAQKELESALRSTGVRPSSTQTEALAAANEEFRKPAGIPQPAVASSAERPTIKDENGNPLMYADNPASAPASSGVALPPKEPVTAPVTAPAAEPITPAAPAKVTPITEGKKVGRKTAEQTQADMAEAIKGTKLEAFQKANPGATIADYMATQKGRQEIENFLKGNPSGGYKPVKGLESPVKKTQSKATKSVAAKPESSSTASLSPEASRLKSTYDLLPDHYKKEGITWPQAINQAKADAKVIEYLVKNGRTIKDWKAADKSTKNLIRSEAGVTSKGDPDGERLTKTWELAIKK